jgi:hypothetical protein
VAELGLGTRRAVRVRFARPVDPDDYRVDGIGGVEVDALAHRFTLSAPPADLLARLAPLPVEDLVMEPLRLEDLFRELYRPEVEVAGSAIAAAGDGVR